MAVALASSNDLSVPTFFSKRSDTQGIACGILDLNKSINGDGGGGCLAHDFFAERLAHPRRGWKPEFKLERYPPLDGASCSLIGSSSTEKATLKFETIFISGLCGTSLVRPSSVS